MESQSDTCLSSPEFKKNLSSAEKSRMYNVFCDFVKKGDSERIAVQKSSVALKVSERSMWRVIREKKNSGVLQSPKKPKGRPSLENVLDEVDKSIIRRKVHEFFFRNELPTLNKLHSVVKNDPDLPKISRSGLYTILKNLNIKYVSRKRDSILTEKSEIINWRRNYLEKVKEFRQLGNKVYYLDETWVNEGLTKAKVWKDLNVTSTSQAFREGLSTGLINPTSRGKRLIVLHIGNEDGFVPDGLLVFESKKTGDYHEDMNSEVFENWFSRILSKLQNNSIIVMDNAPYHSRKVEKIPTTAWKKDDIKQWLTSKGISFQDEILKTQLLALVKTRKRDFDKYAVDEMAREAGHEVLRLPPYHCELNPIELIWAQIKNEVSSKNTTFKLNQVKILLNNAIKNITDKKWADCVKYVVETMEKKYWELDNIMEEITERLVINLNDDDSSESEESE